MRQAPAKEVHGSGEFARNDHLPNVLNVSGILILERALTQNRIHTYFRSISLCLTNGIGLSTLLRRKKLLLTANTSRRNSTSTKTCSSIHGSLLRTGKMTQIRGYSHRILAELPLVAS